MPSAPLSSSFLRALLLIMRIGCILMLFRLTSLPFLLVAATPSKNLQINKPKAHEPECKATHQSGKDEEEDNDSCIEHAILFRKGLGRSPGARP